MAKAKKTTTTTTTVEESAPTIKSYTFTALCNSGETKEVSFEAASYKEARKKLQEFINSN